MLDELNRRFPTIEQTGAKVARIERRHEALDAAHIVPSDADAEDDRKPPMIMTNDVRQGTFKWGGSVLLNPWLPDGKASWISPPSRSSRRQYSRHPKPSRAARRR